jgi:phospholipid/cholesterol/gamma-HCH transport system ATP-binding protein
VLLKTLTGLHRPNAGEVRLGGRRIETIGATEKAALIGVLFQQGALFSSLSVAQNIMLPLREHTNLGPKSQHAIAAMKLRLAGLSADVGAKFPSQLSGGMVKRAALARALALDPRILFLDEPTSDLDPIAAAEIDELIRRLNEGLRITVIVVTHDLTTLFSICHRVALLVDGKLAIGTPEGLRRSGEPGIREFLRGPRADAAMTARRH